jgi:RNA polymerase sigma factor for flagellar operon FliA
VKGQVRAGRPPQRASAELDELWRRYKATGDVGLRNQLVEAYLALAERLARRAVTYAVSVGAAGASPEDLLGMAQEGLIKAVESFDPSKGASFSAYAGFRVMGHIKDTLREDDFLSRRARQVVKAWLKGEQLDQRRAAQAARLASQRPVRLSPRAVEEVVGDQGPEEAGLTRAQVRELLARLDPMEKAVLTYRYLQNMSLSAIGAVLAVTESRACQLHRAALEKLRQEVSTQAS